MLEVKNISFSYGTEKVLKNIHFEISKGNIISIIGASGSGKSTLLKLIYGLLDADEGGVFWNENEILGPKYHLVPGMEFMKYLAQDFDLMPYVSVGENVGRFLSNFYLEEKAHRINELLTLVEMTEFIDVKAKFLSGGQMQRVALARVLALEPEVLLLDEPFSHIDAFQKNKLSRHLFNYCKEKNITVLFTSHTPEEALMFSDEIIVMQNGTIIEKDSPQLIYQLPKNEYIARLTGDVNILPVKYLGVNNDEVLFLRPHQLKISNIGFEAKVIKSYFKGNFYLIEVIYKNQKYYFESDKILSNESYVRLSI